MTKLTANILNYIQYTFISFEDCKCVRQKKILSAISSGFGWKAYPTRLTLVTPSKYNLKKTYKSYFNIAINMIHFCWWTLIQFCLNIKICFALVCHYRMKSLLQKSQPSVYAIRCRLRSPVSNRVSNQTLWDIHIPRVTILGRKF